MFDEEKPKKTAEIVLPRNLDGLSVSELHEYIATLRLEIMRTETKIASDHEHQAAAEAFFK